MTRKKLAINLVAGIMDIVNIFLLSGSGIFIIMASVMTMDTGASDETYVLIGLFYIASMIMAIAGLVLHIVALVQSKKVGISITGHVLGIVAYGVYIVSLAILGLPAIIVLVIAAIFTLMQKNVDPFADNEDGWGESSF